MVENYNPFWQVKPIVTEETNKFRKRKRISANLAQWNLSSKIKLITFDRNGKMKEICLTLEIFFSKTSYVVLKDIAQVKIGII